MTRDQRRIRLAIADLQATIDQLPEEALGPLADRLEAAVQEARVTVTGRVETTSQEVP